LETLAPSTDRRAGSEALNWVGAAEIPPDTVRDRSAGGTLPLTVVPTVVSATETAPLKALQTEPLAEPIRVREPVRVVTAPVVITAPQRAPLTYEVYIADDTLRGKPAIQVELANDARRRRLGMWILGITLALGTALAAVGSCEDQAASPVETTPAPAPVTSASAAREPTPASTAVTPLAVPAFTPVPPLAPAPSVKPPRRRPPPRPGGKR
jgi:hypothetical protein